MQGDVAGVVAGQHRRETDEGVKMLGIRHLDIAELAGGAFGHLVQREVRARRVADRQLGIGAAMHDDGRLAAQVAIAPGLVDASLHLQRGCVGAGHQVAQAQRAVQVEVSQAR